MMKKFLSAVTALCMVSSMAASALPANIMAASIEDVGGEYTWYITDVQVEAGQKMVPVEVRVANSPNDIGGYTFGLTIDGKKGEDAVKSTTLKLSDEIFQGPDDDATPTAYSELALFEMNPANLQVGGGGSAPATAADGAAVMTYYFDIPDDAKDGTVYKLGIDADIFKVKTNNSQLVEDIKILGGTITVGEVPDDTEPQPNTDPLETDPPVVVDGYRWEVDKVTAKPGDKSVPVEVKVYDSPSNIGGYTFGLTIDGKKGEDAVKSTTLKLADDIYKGPDDDAATPTAYSELALFEWNPANLQVGGGGATPATAEDGAAVMVFYFDIPEDAAPGTIWKLGIDEDQFTIKDNSSKVITGVSFDAGFLKIAGDEDPTEPDTEKSTEKPTEKPTDKETDKPTDVTNYIYGDLNKNGVVELVDIVILNRYLTGYEDQQLDDYQMEVANCQYDKKIDGADSVTILKHKIGLIETLPVGKK